MALSKEDLEAIRLLMREETSLLRQEVNQRFDKVDERFAQVDDRLDKVDDRFNKVDERLDKVDEQLEFLARTAAEEFNEINRRFESMQNEMKENTEIILRKFDVAVENVRHDMAKANEEEIAALNDKVTQHEERLDRLERRVA